VVPTAISPYLRHPMPTAMALATIAEASPGNVALSIGVGNPMFLGESGLTVEKPVRAMRESVEMLRALFGGEPVTQAGMLHALRGARLAFVPREPIPIYIAPMKEQNLRLSGQIADGVVLSAGLSAGFVKHSLAFVDDERRAVPGGAKPFVKAGYVYFLASNNAKAAYDTLRMRLAFLMRNRYIDDNIAHSGLPIDQQAIMAAIAARDFDKAARLVPDEAVEAFAIAGTPRQCRDGIARFIGAGLNELVLIMVGEADDRRLGYDLIRDFSRPA
jgi:alkanesulfonate monooxygenase SsuD/methylene tetrahydromethanopterin reductase-like flavin-dependent oxidoreductase (luciferase family)